VLSAGCAAGHVSCPIHIKLSDSEVHPDGPMSMRAPAATIYMDILLPVRCRYLDGGTRSGAGTGIRLSSIVTSFNDQTWSTRPGFS